MKQKRRKKIKRKTTGERYLQLHYVLYTHIIFTTTAIDDDDIDNFFLLPASRTCIHRMTASSSFF